MAATAVCATVRAARIPAHFSHFFVLLLIFILILLHIHRRPPRRLLAVFRTMSRGAGSSLTSRPVPGGLCTIIILRSSVLVPHFPTKFLLSRRRHSCVLPLPAGRLCLCCCTQFTFFLQHSVKGFALSISFYENVLRPAAADAIRILHDDPDHKTPPSCIFMRKEMSLFPENRHLLTEKIIIYDKQLP